MAKRGIKETMDALIALEQLGQKAAAALEDGKVNLFDIGLLLGFIPAARDAMEGAKDIPLEIKDLDSEEIDQIVAFLPVLFGAWAGMITKKG